MHVILLNKNIYDLIYLQKISKRKEQLIMNVELGISTFGETTPLEKQVRQLATMNGLEILLKK